MADGLEEETLGVEDNDFVINEEPGMLTLQRENVSIAVPVYDDDIETAKELARTRYQEQINEAERVLTEEQRLVANYAQIMFGRDKETTIQFYLQAGFPDLATRALARYTTTDTARTLSLSELIGFPLPKEILEKIYDDKVLLVRNEPHLREEATQVLLQLDRSRTLQFLPRYLRNCQTAAS